MKWSPQQEKALSSVAAWQKAKQYPYYYLAGYAGTGKTTLAKEFASDVPGRVLYAAYTGKAAHVMRQHGCDAASTIHSLIYRAKDKCREHYQDLKFQIDRLLEEDKAVPDNLQQELTAEKENLSRPNFSLRADSNLIGADLLILDECSMVDTYIAEDLLLFGVPILVLGDPAQLPPVRRAGYFTKHEPSFMLTEVHRHALDSPIYRMATEIREGRLPQLGDEGVIAQADLLDPPLIDADQVIVGKNVTRHRVNQRMRRIEGRWHKDNDLPHLPWKGDKLVCLRNNHEVGLLNGSLWKADTVMRRELNRLRIKVVEEEAEGYSLEVDVHPEIFNGKDLDHLPFYIRKEKEEFDYGYALTAHKAQGSQWGHVLVLDESDVFRSQRRKWLYTAVTRASESVTVVVR